MTYVYIKLYKTVGFVIPWLVTVSDLVYKDVKYRQQKNFEIAEIRFFIYVLYYIKCVCRVIESGFGGLVVSMLASGTQDCGFDPGRSRRIFRAKKSTTEFLQQGFPLSQRIR